MTSVRVDVDAADGGRGLDLVMGLLPMLARRHAARFNVFDVMRYGTHEKQLSGVFAWLLDAGGTHCLGDRFLRVFLDNVNSDLRGAEPAPNGEYVVLQEVNTVGPSSGDGADIADIVLYGDTVRLIVENYYTSDGHGHSYHGYRRYGERDGRRAIVVLLCEWADPSLQEDGWEQAPVVTYAPLIAALHEVVTADRKYRDRHPDVAWFITQMHRRFVAAEGQMDTDSALGFVTQMCRTEEAGRYGAQSLDAEADRFAADISQQARAAMTAGRDVLAQVKARLKSFSETTLKRQLTETFGGGFVTAVRAPFRGIYTWSINFAITDPGDNGGEAPLQFKFGPSAWKANENNDYWTDAVTAPDYAYVFVTRQSRHKIRQTTVTLAEVIAGLEPDDRRLHDAIVAIMRPDEP